MGLPVCLFLRRYPANTPSSPAVKKKNTTHKLLTSSQHILINYFTESHTYKYITLRGPQCYFLFSLCDDPFETKILKFHKTSTILIFQICKDFTCNYLLWHSGLDMNVLFLRTHIYAKRGLVEYGK